MKLTGCPWKSGQTFVVSFLLLGQSYGGSAPTGSHVLWTCARSQTFPLMVWLNCKHKDFTVPVLYQTLISCSFSHARTFMCRLDSSGKPFFLLLLLLLLLLLPPSLPPSLPRITFLSPFLLSPLSPASKSNPGVPVLSCQCSDHYSYSYQTNTNPHNPVLSYLQHM